MVRHESGRVAVTHVQAVRGQRLRRMFSQVGAFGQKRALAVWQRVILLYGRSLRIVNVPATAAGGDCESLGKGRPSRLANAQAMALSTLLGGRLRTRPVGPAMTLPGRSECRRGIASRAQMISLPSTASLFSRPSRSDWAHRFGYWFIAISSSSHGGEAN